MASKKQFVLLNRSAHFWRLIALLVGDICVFLIFAAVGRKTHQEVVDFQTVLEVIGTAAPFAAGWFLVAPWLGIYREYYTANVRSMLIRTASAWLCAWPVALLLRGIFWQEIPPVSFAMVVLVVNLLFLSVWRGLFALLAYRKR